MSFDHLVGKWVLVDSHMINGVCSRVPHFVESVSKGRIYICGCSKEWIQEKKEFEFRPELDETERSFKQAKNIIFVFDNFEDAASAGRTIHDQWNEWWTNGLKLRKLAEQIATRTRGQINK